MTAPAASINPAAVYPPLADGRTSRHFTFDARTHIYRVDGVQVPGVTTVIKPLYGDFYQRIDPDTLRAAAERGTRVHRLTEIADTCADHHYTRDDIALLPYVDAWEAFKREMSPRLVSVEEQNYHPELPYAGTCDRILVIDGHIGVADLKATAELMPQTAVQAMGYALIQAAWNGRGVNSPLPLAWRRWGIQLLPSGRYRFERYDGAYWDEATFRACLHLYYNPDGDDEVTLRARENVAAWKRKHHVA